MDERVRVHLLFADSGTFHSTHVMVEATRLEGYPRLIDALREDAEIQKRLYVDLSRLSAAWLPPAGPERGGKEPAE